MLLPKRNTFSDSEDVPALQALFAAAAPSGGGGGWRGGPAAGRGGGWVWGGSKGGVQQEKLGRGVELSGVRNSTLGPEMVFDVFLGSIAWGFEHNKELPAFGMATRDWELQQFSKLSRFVVLRKPSFYFPQEGRLQTPCLLLGDFNVDPEHFKELLGVSRFWDQCLRLD